MASLNKILLAGAVPIGTPGLSHYDRILGQALGGREVEKTATPGDIVTFSTNLAKPLTSLKVLITATQSGTGDPSPTNIRPITGWTGCTITRQGADLTHGPISGAGNINDSGKIVSRSGTKVYYITCGNGKTYRYRTSDSYVQAYYNSTPEMGSISYDGARIVSQNPIDMLAPINGFAAFRATTDEAAPECRQTDEFTTAFGDAGTVYGGTLDVLTGVLTVTMASIDLGNLNWTLFEGNIAKYFRASWNLRSPGQTLNALSDRYKVVIGSQVSSANGQIGVNANAQYLYVRDDAYTDAADFKTAVTGSLFVYELSTPQTYQLTPQAVDALLGENVVFADTGAVSELKYLVKE